MAKELKFINYCASQAYEYFKKLREDRSFREERQSLVRNKLQEIKQLSIEEIKSRVPFSFHISEFKTPHHLPPNCIYDLNDWRQLLFSLNDN